MDGYSKLIAWLKVLLPLVALGLLSTLFLLSRSVESTSTIPFAEAEIRDRIAHRRMTEPFFSGATTSGDSVTFSASELGTGTQGLNEATDVFAQLDLKSGTRITVVADAGKFDLAKRKSDLMGNVVITTTKGFTLRSQTLRADLENATLASPARVEGSGLFGTLTAGQMAVTASGDDGPAQLIFTNGVKLVYDPKQIDE